MKNKSQYFVTVKNHSAKPNKATVFGDNLTAVNYGNDTAIEITLLKTNKTYLECLKESIGAEIISLSVVNSSEGQCSIQRHKDRVEVELAANMVVELLIEVSAAVEKQATKFNLDMENFWKPLYAKYTGEVEQFCKWMDEYKKKNNWNKLFNSDSDYQNSEGKNAPAPKYHELPIAMQIGIFYQFTLETGRRYAFIIEEEDTLEEIAENIEEWFCEEHSHALQEHQQAKHDFEADHGNHEPGEVYIPK